MPIFNIIIIVEILNLKEIFTDQTENKTATHDLNEQNETYYIGQKFCMFY